jgi:hypothetical protein
MSRILLLGVWVVTGVVTASAQTSAPAKPGAATPATPAPSRAARAATPTRPGVPSVLPGTRETAFSTIQGNALDSTNSNLPDSLVRLRDARLGRIVNTQITDKSGLFEFRAVDPGSYIVELLDKAATVLAASQLLSVNAGEALSAVVKLPFQPAFLGGVLGHTASHAASVTAAAAATGVMNVTATTDVSPDGTQLIVK